jgi:hypothetical protein
MEEIKTRIPPKIMAELRDFYEDIDPHKSLQAITEVMRMIGKDEMMQEADPAAEEFWYLLYRLNKILWLMQDHRSEQNAEKIKDMETEIARLKRRAKR